MIFYGVLHGENHKTPASEHAFAVDAGTEHVFFFFGAGCPNLYQATETCLYCFLRYPLLGELGELGFKAIKASRFFGPQPDVRKL